MNILLQMVTVSVVGGGAAGLAALAILAKAGVDVRLFEASNRLGGRVHSDSGLELGAQWVHGEEGNSLYSLAKQLNALPDVGDEFSVSDSDSVNLWDDGEELGKEMASEFECLFSNLEEKLKEEVHLVQKFTSQVRKLVLLLSIFLTNYRVTFLPTTLTLSWKSKDLWEVTKKR